MCCTDCRPADGLLGGMTMHLQQCGSRVRGSHKEIGVIEGQQLLCDSLLKEDVAQNQNSKAQS